MDTDYQLLKEKMESFIQGSISSSELKKVSAPLGIYEQKNGLFMIRVRIPGGDIKAEELQKLIDVCKNNSIPYAHITTRQDLQLHDVPPGNTQPVVIDLVKADFPVRGGGGNTFRNIIVDEMSDISEEAVFDVRPYAFELNDFILGYDHAFELPRKFKIGFFGGDTQNNTAFFQDLSFDAVMQGDRKAFDVYGGGGFGRKGRKGVKIFSALPVGEMSRCAVAGIEMFYDHGDRERRDMARFRFVLDKMGEEKFIKTFLEYFYQSDVGTRKIDSDLKEKLPAVPFFGNFDQKQPFFEEWFDRCVLRTRWKDIYALKILIPRGNLEPFRLNALADLAHKYSGNIVRLTRSQDILLPYVHATALPYIHDELHNGDLAAFLQVSFRSKIVSCVGASVCKMGFFDSMEYAVLLSNELDKLFKDFPNISDKDKQQIVDAIKVSGCPNSCGGHLLAPLGFEGIKKRNTGNSSELCFSVFTGGSVSGETSRLAEPVDEYYVPAEHLATFVKDLVSAYLNRHGDVAETFADYICSIGKDTIKKYYPYPE